MASIKAVGRVFKKIGSFFKKLGLALFGKEALEKLADAGKAVLASALGKIVWAVVQEVENIPNLTGTDKYEEAFKRITGKAVEAGMDVRESFINLLIEMAVQRLKGIVPE